MREKQGMKEQQRKKRRNVKIKDRALIWLLGCEVVQHLQAPDIIEGAA